MLNFTNAISPKTSFLVSWDIFYHKRAQNCSRFYSVSNIIFMRRKTRHRLSVCGSVYTLSFNSELVPKALLLKNLAGIPSYVFPPCLSGKNKRRISVKTLKKLTKYRPKRKNFSKTNEFIIRTELVSRLCRLHLVGT